MSSQGKTMSEVNSEIDEAQDAINRILSQAASERRNLREDELAEIAGYNARIAELQQQQLEIYRRQQNAALVKARLEGANLTKEAAAALIKEAKAGYDQVVEYADKVYTNRVIELEQEKNSIVERHGTEHYQKLLDQAKQDRNDRVQVAADIRDETLDIVQDGGEQWLESEEGVLNELGRLAGDRQDLNDQILESEENTVNGINVQRDILKGKLRQNQEKTAEILADMVRDNDSAAINNIRAWMQMEAGIIESGGNITADAAQTAEGILGAFEDLPPELQEQGRETLLALAEGLEDKIPELKDAADMTTDELITAMRDYLGLDGGNSEGEKIGNEYVDDVAEGTKDKQSTVNKAGKDTADTLSKSTEKQLGTNETGRKNKGKHTGQKYGESLEDGVAGKQSDLEGTAEDVAAGMSGSFWSWLGLSSSGTANKGYDAGQTLFNSIGQGSNATIDSLLSIARGIASSVMSAILSSFGIASPSTFGLGVGKNLITSIGTGWLENLDATLYEMQHSLDLGTSRLQTEIELNAAVAQAQASSSIHTYAPNYTITANQPIGQREIMQQIQLDQQRQRLYAG